MSASGKDRNKAKRIVEQQKAAERRRQVTIWTSASVVVVLLMAGLIAWGVLAGQKKGQLNVPPGAVDKGTAFAVGTGPVTLDLYEDFMCPICHEFENGSAPQIKQWVADKKITVRYHPVAILDRSSNGTRFSTRAAAAAAAAGVAGKIVEFHDVMYANQPQENSDGLSNAKIIELAKSIGLTNQDFVDAVNSGRYEQWATNATNEFAKRGYTGTPTILVNGKQVHSAGEGVPGPQDLAQAIAAAG